MKLEDDTGIQLKVSFDSVNTQFYSLLLFFIISLIVFLYLFMINFIISKFIILYNYYLNYNSYNKNLFDD